MISNFIQSETGIILLSVIWGLGLATLFHRSCQGPKCRIVTYRGPGPETHQRYWEYGTGQCYRVYPYVVPCSGA